MERKQKRRRRPRKPGCDISDAEVLDLIRSGRLIVSPQGTAVYSVVKGVARKLAIQADNGRGYLFVRFQLGRNAIRRRRGIAVHRLVWMAVTGELIPDGYEIDHGDRVVTNNDPGNLTCLPGREHQSENRRAYWERKRNGDGCADEAADDDTCHD